VIIIDLGFLCIQFLDLRYFSRTIKEVKNKMRKLLTSWIMLQCLILLSVCNVSAIPTEIVGDIVANTTWGPTGSPGYQNTEFLLRGSVFVKAPAILTIQPGVKVYGEQASIGMLVVDRGAKLNAIGTPTQPIVFTSEKVYLGQTPARGDWGGLILNGYAPINIPGGEAFGEGDTGIYGGGNPADNSGNIQYVRVEYAGHLYTPENELNGIAFQGVGNGTTVDYVQVHMNDDDCIEQFGGTVNMKHMLGTWCRDDGFDWTDGWTGLAQYVAIVWSQELVSDSGQESDNQEFGHELQPRSHPTIYNMTFIGPGQDAPITSGQGIRVRRGTAGEERNFVVMNFKSNGLRIDDASTMNQLSLGELNLNNACIRGNNLGGIQCRTTAGNVDCETINPFLEDDLDCNLCNPMNVNKPNLVPAPGSPLLDGTIPVATPPSGMSTREWIGDTANGRAGGTPVGDEDGLCEGGEACIDYGSFFDVTDYIGAIDPDAIADPSLDWTYGWTTFGQPKLLGDVTSPEGVQVSDAIRIGRIAINLNPHVACENADKTGGTTIGDAIRAGRMAINLSPKERCCN
jgi:hypothetical protein